MKITITYEHGTTEYPYQATVKLDNGEYAIGSGRSINEATNNVIERVKVKSIALPPPLEIEVDI